MAEEQETAAAETGKASWGKRIGLLLGLVLALFVAAVALLNSPIGKRWIAEQIAGVAPASGLQIEVGRIEGDIFHDARLLDVVLSDPQGEFLRIPEAEIDWRPLSWLFRGIDIRGAVARRARLMRVPELLPGDPDAPYLPDFDIRIDRLEIDNLTIAAGIIDAQEHRVDLTARADIRSGLADLDIEGKLGAQDRFLVDLRAEPDGNIFDLELDYVAPQGGVIAGLIGAQAGYEARVRGDGTWQDWQGFLTIDRNDANMGGFRLTNQAGMFGLVGQVDAAPVTSGLTEQALGPRLTLAAFSTLEASVLDGAFRLRSGSINARARGRADLADNALDDVEFAMELTDPDLLGDSLRLEDARVEGTADGAFRSLAVDHRLEIGRLVAGTTKVSGIVQQGRARLSEDGLRLPLDIDIARVETGLALADPHLVDGSVSGQLVLSGPQMSAELLRIAFPGASAQLALNGDVTAGRYSLTGPVAVNGLEFENIGLVNAAGEIDLALAADAPWALSVNVEGSIPRITNETLVSFAGPQVTFSGGVSLGGDTPVDVRAFQVEAEKLNLSLDGSIAPERSTLAGTGRHADYGPFTIEGAYSERGPEAVLVLAEPLPAAGLRDVRVALAPSEQGFAIIANGESVLGPFDGSFGLAIPDAGPTQLAINQLRIWRTDVTGVVGFGEAGAQGTLRLAGGGIDGTVRISPDGTAQVFAVDLEARNAVFGGATPVSIRRASIEGKGRLQEGSSTVDASVFAQGISYGTIFVGRLAATADLTDGRGDMVGSIAGRRGSRFNMQWDADITPDRFAVAVRGDFAGKALHLPRRAVLTRREAGGWSLAQTQLSYDRGRVVAEGTFGADEFGIRAWFDRLPLTLVDIAVADQGLGGRISGTAEYSTGEGRAPTGSARVKVDRLTRSGLLLSSRPIDLGLVAELRANRLEARATIADDEGQRGRAQARITGLPSSGALYERLSAGDLFGQLRFNGPAQSLWRLSTIEAFDLVGPVNVSADVRGTLANPRVRGAVSSDNLQLQSSLSGTDVRNVSVRGSFAGSRLRLTRFAGTASNGGSVSGSGVVDLAGINATRGPEIDLRISARDAQLLNANGIDATVTGPIRIVSNGVGGTIAGKVKVDNASWALGIAAEDVRLPAISTREINARADIAPARRPYVPWRYLIDAQSTGRVDVDGLGLDSEWEAKIELRGTTDDPRIGGAARMIRGFYTFAGTRFELVRGRIAFDANRAIDPRLDILAETERDGLDVNVAVRGSALQPEITFGSTPSLPEEEILSRLLFGGSVTELSATDALQLGAALASLRGGGGMDPINRLRSAIGLDRLRIVSADPALGRATGVALGKNVSRRLYVELITDGRGYSASEVEFRVTSWLSLLGAVSTIGRESVVAEISRDY